MNIPSHFDIEEKLLSDKTSRCNKVLLKFYYLVVCFLKSFVLIALALAIIVFLFEQIGVEFELDKLLENILKEQTYLNLSNKHINLSNVILHNKLK